MTTADLKPSNLDAPKRYYSTARLSEKISQTPEGFLVCESVPISRAGQLLYAAGETPIEPGKDGRVVMSRTVEDIHDQDTIASFEGKPVTINHPDDFVTPQNWRELTVGIVQNVRPGEGEDADKLLADLLITDAEAISAVKSKQLREVSCGYEAEYVEDGPGRGRQENIIGNHVALVAAGRCGPECAIHDHAPKKEPSFMGFKEKISAIFGKALDDALLDEQPASKDAAPDETAVKDEDVGAVLSALSARLDAIESTLAKMASMEESEDAKMSAEAKAEPETETEEIIDAETIARAEILCPGIEKSGDIKSKALDSVLKTEEGKGIISTLLAGKTYDQVDKDLLFVAAAEVIKGVRRSQLTQAHVSLDSLPGIKAGEMTPEKINQRNAALYGKHLRSQYD